MCRLEEKELIETFEKRIGSFSKEPVACEKILVCYNKGTNYKGFTLLIQVKEDNVSERTKHCQKS